MIRPCVSGINALTPCRVWFVDTAYSRSLYATRTRNNKFCIVAAHVGNHVVLVRQRYPQSVGSDNKTRRNTEENTITSAKNIRAIKVTHSKDNKQGNKKFKKAKWHQNLIVFEWVSDRPKFIWNKTFWKERNFNTTDSSITFCYYRWEWNKWSAAETYFEMSSQPRILLETLKKPTFRLYLKVLSKQMKYNTIWLSCKHLERI